MDTTRRHLTELATLSHKTEQAERKILAQAHEALDRAQADIKRLRPLALVPGAAESQEYQQAIMDRGRLHQVIAQANKILAGTDN